MRALTSEVNPAASVSGFVPCGTPQTIEASVEEYIPLPVSIFGSGELFIVRASHDSMIEAASTTAIWWSCGNSRQRETATSWWRL
jgi:SOS-response transcriptional repressor LexA